jgi:hypothetical protein
MLESEFDRLCRLQQTAVSLATYLQCPYFSILFNMLKIYWVTPQSVVFKILAIPLLLDLKKMEEIRNTGTSNKPTPLSSLHTKQF